MTRFTLKKEALTNQKGEIGIETVMILGMAAIIFTGFVLPGILDSKHEAKLNTSNTYEVTPTLVGVSRIKQQNGSTAYSIDYAIEGQPLGGEISTARLELHDVKGQPLSVNLTCSTISETCDSSSIVKAVVTGDLSQINELIEAPKPDSDLIIIS